MATIINSSEVGLDIESATKFLAAVNDGDPVTGLTHTFYRYPGRFSPLFARTAIELFTDAGDLILDGFMGGATSLVEARTVGRRSIGTDVSELAVFLARVKTTVLSEKDLTEVALWATTLNASLNLRSTVVRDDAWIQNGYQRNINTVETWPIRKLLELALSRITDLSNRRQRDFARCAVLKCGQWALDCRKTIPTVEQFRHHLALVLVNMMDGARQYAVATRIADKTYDSQDKSRTLCLHRSVIGIENDTTVIDGGVPRLILLSPPYPGVYVLYHRWKVQGRKETPAPFWIANTLDGSGMSHYTLGDRKQRDLRGYFTQIGQAFGSLAKLADPNTWVTQMVGFSDPSWQLPRYLEMLDQAGFEEIKFRDFRNSRDGRLWREVPNRKWFAAYQQTAESTGKEVVLFHKLRGR